MSRVPSPSDEVERALGSMSALLDANRFDDFIAAEVSFYSRYIRTTETHDHHDRMFRRLEPLVSRYGRVLARGGPVAAEASRDSSVCYFLPSLDNDLAHIELLSTLLKAAGPNRPRTTYIAGFAMNPAAVGSRNIAVLARDHGVKVVLLALSHGALVSFCRWFLDNRIGLLVHYSIPTLLPCWLEVFGSDRVAWFISKFELECFSRLRHGISAAGTRYEVVFKDRVRWRRAPSSLPEHYFFQHALEHHREIRLISINREEKLRNPAFLGAVTEILRRNPVARFYWTGRHRDALVTNFFGKNNLEGRQEFVGWVNHREVLPVYDFFLDTFGLSGMVAASAFSSGMPIVLMRGSGSWVEAFESEVEQDAQAHGASFQEQFDSVLAQSPEDYVEKVQRLLARVTTGKFDGSWQREVGRRWFFNASRAFGRHERALADIFQDSATG